ncbi:MAG TPA: indole-3-glycerol phosphate synthase TrpC [Gaiellales bacterium]|nr:indole-3-glycerol phosphate synthase TrpC [Gaiellales bacterium]
MSGYLTRLSGDIRRDAPDQPRGFADALAAGPSVAVIAEVKRASPSQGAIRADADVVETAVRYEDGGAACVSVLCAERDFGGSPDDLSAARGAISIPALAKDFTVFPEQVARQRIAGADAVLVILGMVSDDEAKRLSETARLLGMDVLVEANDAAQVERAVALGSRMIGVNARNLETLEVDRDAQLELLASLPEGSLRIAESGVASRADVEAARDAGAHAVLVGTSLMRSPELLGELVGVPR